MKAEHVILGLAILVYCYACWFAYDTVRVIKREQRERLEYSTVINKVGKAIDEYSKIQLDSLEKFEATGYSAEPLEDGRVKVTFLQKIAPRGQLTETDPKAGADGEAWARHREVIMPAWMWAQVTAEAALKVGFEALDKKRDATNAEDRD